MRKKKLIGKDYAQMYSSIQEYEIPHEIVIERPVYFDGRQFSFKIPKKIMEYTKYDPSDKIRFKITNLRTEKPKIEMEYIKENVIQN